MTELETWFTLIAICLIEIKINSLVVVIQLGGCGLRRLPCSLATYRP